MKISLTLFILFFCFKSYSQVDPKIDKNNQSIITNSPLIFANGTDNILYQGDYSFHNNFDSLVVDKKSINATYTFNKNGQISQIIKHHGDPFSCEIFYYTKDGILDRSYFVAGVSQIDNLLDSVRTDIYYLKDHFTEMARSSDFATITKYQHNESGKVLTSVVVKREGSENVTSFQYDEKGRIVKLLKDKVLKYLYVYDVNNNLSLKEEAPQILMNPKDFKYIEAEKYLYNEGKLVQIDKVCKSNKNINVRVSTAKINQTIPLTPVLANSVYYMNSNNTQVSIVNALNPKWETLSSTIFSSTYNEFKNWSTRKVFNIQKGKKKELSKIEFQEFASETKLAEAKKKEDDQVKEKERILETEKAEKQKEAMNVKKRQADAYKEKQKIYELKMRIQKSNDEIINQYGGLYSKRDSRFSEINMIGDHLNLSKAKRKKIIFDTYISIYSTYIRSESENELIDMDLIQTNMRVLLEAKTKKIEKEIADQKTLSEQVSYLKNALNFVDK